MAKWSNLLSAPPMLEYRIYESKFKRMVNKAKELHDMQLYFTIKAMGMTGARVNELKSFTTESISKDHVNVNEKGRIRRCQFQEN